MVLKQYNYSRIAKYYDALELKGGDGPFTSDFLDKILKRHKVKTLLDMTCGTGAQSIGLYKKGYKVTASDINKEMLSIARRKAKNGKIKFYNGDIRTSHFGRFDAVIAMFNAIGHLTKKDFERAIKNVARNLNERGLFVLDIFNLDFMKSGGFIKHRFIDTAIEREGMKFVRFSKNQLNSRKGVLRINQECYLQEGFGKPKIQKESWDMQLYSTDELSGILEKNGFKVVRLCDLRGGRLIKKKSLHIVVTARKCQAKKNM